MAPASPLASLWPRYRRTLRSKQVALCSIIVNICPEYTLTLMFEIIDRFLTILHVIARNNVTLIQIRTDGYLSASEVIDVSEIRVWAKSVF